jgi:hypothetical protein
MPIIGGSIRAISDNRAVPLQARPWRLSRQESVCLPTNHRVKHGLPLAHPSGGGFP